MRLVTFNLIVLVTLLCIGQIRSQHSDSANREFRVDYPNNRFMRDGKPFRYVSGSFHYYRTMPDQWQQRFRTMRAAGLNAISTYVEWSMHNPKPDTYVWDGMADLDRFIRLAAEEDLLVILRVGPFICSERDMGGFPYWLLTKYPNIKLRTYDADYIKEIRIWYKQLFPRITKHLYGSGGPIIMVQVENEYGSYACDENYKQWLQDEIRGYVGDKAVLFTADGPSLVKCGQFKNVLATINFGVADNKSVDSFWKQLREHQPNGPLVDSEFYPGWLTHWQQGLARVQPKPIVDTFRHLMDQGASVNFLMFSGGTNFGFSAGANDGGAGKYEPDITSYDFDAPMDEAGDPTQKYMLIREAIKDYLPLPNISVPMRAPKMKLPSVKLLPKAALLSPNARQKLGHLAPQTFKVPVTFEKIDQFSGFVLYETVLPNFRKDPSILSAPNVKDRAHVFVDNILIGILSRQNVATTIALTAAYAGKKIQILVENQGRINQNVMNDFKGLGDVKLDDKMLENWTITGFPLSNVQQLEDLIRESDGKDVSSSNSDILYGGPIIYHATFNIDQATIHDTYVNPTGWGKGILFINGFNLGRYWPLAGPQITLYLPKQLLRKGSNSLILIELEKHATNGHIQFSDKPIFD